MQSEGFAHWLGRRFFKETQKALNPETLKSSLANFEAQTRFEGDERPVFLRIGSLDEKIYINLCNKEWEAVEIDSKGWRVINNPPVRFRRVAGMKELPRPVKEVLSTSPEASLMSGQIQILCWLCHGSWLLFVIRTLTLS